MRLIGYNSDYAYDNYSSLAKAANEISRKNKGLAPKNKKHSGGKARRYGDTCCYCEVELTRLTFSWDHLHPKSLGGRVKKPCCRACNAEKKDMTLEQYLSYIQYRRLMVESGMPEYILMTRKIQNIRKLMLLKPDQV